MRLIVTAGLCAFLFVAAGCAGSEERPLEGQVAPLDRTLVGQLLLPDGVGSRGIEVTATVATGGGEPQVAWVLFDEEGRFSHAFRGRVTDVEVGAGGNRVVYRVESGEIPAVDPAGQLDLGVIDLRSELRRHRLTIRAAEGAAHGDVRVAMWHGPPPTGPQGEPVSLGSRQFPTRSMGSEVEWLIPRQAQSIYFLVERHSESRTGKYWISGEQRLFGPFTEADLPAELTL